jgi:hypothetical protein
MTAGAIHTTEAILLQTLALIPSSAQMESTWSKLVKLFWAIYGLLLLAVDCDGVVAMVVLSLIMAPVALALVILYSVIFFPIWVTVKFVRLCLPASRFGDEDREWTL